MKLLSMKKAVVVAVVAAIVGVGAVCAHPELVQQHWKPAAVVAFISCAAYSLMKIMEYMEYIEMDLQWIGEKCTYMKRRVDSGLAKSGDVCRHVQKLLEEFNEDMNEGKTKASKWWWVERRLRCHFEDFSNSKAMEKSSFEEVKKSWNMLQMLAFIEVLFLVVCIVAN